MNAIRQYRIFFALVCLSMMLELTIADANANPKPSTKTELAAIDAYITKQMKDLKIPGIALGIVQDNRIIHLQWFGVADETGRRVTAQTPFRIGSITKSFTALAVMQLEEAGKIDLDAPVQRYLPWFRVADEKASAQITVRHLLNQTSGFSTLAGNNFWDSQAGLEDAVRHLQTMKLSQPVGTRFQYSNINYSIAGLIVEVVSGQPYANYIVQHIFRPLSMYHSFTATAPAQEDGLAKGHLYSMGLMIADAGTTPPAYLPAGFISASVEDLCHYAIAQLNGGRYNSTTIISKDSIAQLHHPAIPVETIRTGLKDTYYGLGWVIGPLNDTPTIWHNGDTGRFHATMIMAPERGTGIALLANASGLEYLISVDDIAKGVLSLLEGKPLPKGSPTRTQYRLVYWLVLLTPLLLLIGIARGWKRWRRGDFAGLKNQPNGQRKQTVSILLMAIPNLAVALFFMFGVPQLTSLPHSAILILYPDVGYALTAGIAIGIVWSVVYTALVLHVKPRYGKPPLAHAEPSMQNIDAGTVGNG